ncbi:MAG: hypothetical protein Q6L68_05215 [Thermostichus sp. DG02_5_bins_236]
MTSITLEKRYSAVILAHLKAQEMDENLTRQQQWKLYLTRRLYEQGYDREGILAMFNLVDWLMHLSPELESEYWQ